MGGSTGSVEDWKELQVAHWRPAIRHNGEPMLSRSSLAEPEATLMRGLSWPERIHSGHAPIPEPTEPSLGAKETACKRGKWNRVCTVCGKRESEIIVRVNQRTLARDPELANLLGLTVYDFDKALIGPKPWHVPANSWAIDPIATRRRACLRGQPHCWDRTPKLGVRIRSTEYEGLGCA